MSKYVYPIPVISRRLEELHEELLTMHNAAPEDDEERATDTPDDWDLVIRDFVSKLHALEEEFTPKFFAVEDAARALRESA